jgi:hypothetical protein
VTNSRTKGKRVEREIARAFGAERNKSDGTTHTDIHTSQYAIEVKARRALPAWIVGAMNQAVADSRGLTPIVVLVQSRVGQQPQRYVLIQLEDFLRLSGNGPPEAAPA